MCQTVAEVMINIKHFRLATLLAVFLGLFVFGTGKVLGENILPNITTACETKSGQLYSFNDGLAC